MKSMKFAICALDDNNNVIATTDSIAAEWSVEMEKAMQDLCGLSISLEIGTIILDEIRKGLRKEDIIKLIEELMEKTKDDN